MDVTLPDGTVIKGVPEGTTKAQLAEKLRANGKDVPKEWLQEPRSSMEKLGRGAALTGRGLIEGAANIPLMATDIPTRIKRSLGYPTGATASEALHSWFNKIGLPEPENTAEKVAEIGGELGPSGATGAIALGSKGAEALQSVARHLMASATKPTLGAWKSGDAAIAIDTMLEKGVNATEGGVKKLRIQIDALNDQIETAIKNSPAMVDKAKAGRYLNGLMDRFRNQVNPNADLDAIRKAWSEFKAHPAWNGTQEMSVQAAQELKRGTYQQLRKKYGEMGSADVEAQKSLARGLKDEISAGVPEVAGLNAEESKLIKTLNVTERRALMDLNKNPGGLAILAHSPLTFAAYMADKSALFKSLVARIAYSGSGPLGAGLGGIAGSSLYEANQLSAPSRGLRGDDPMSVDEAKEVMRRLKQ